MGNRRLVFVALGFVVIAVFGVLAVGASPADARYSKKKAIWGPTQIDGVSQFPTYHDLGVGIYQMQLHWNTTAPTRPQRPGDPTDPTYRWPAEIDFAIREARRYEMRVSLMIIWTPRWANGGRPRRWAPRRPADFAAFARAASRRYPQVRLWQIWGEPSKQTNFMPLPPSAARGPRRYARLLDAAYASLKRESHRNLVIGGSTFTGGEVGPRQFIRWMRLPNGRPPRMDLYGHNPFSARRPNLRTPYLRQGWADFSDLDDLARWVDRNLGKTPRGRPIRLYLSEFTFPTDHPNQGFNFWVTREVQASWLAAALRITHRWSRIYALGWIDLRDQAPNGPNGMPGDETNWGLLEWDGDPKPSYETFKRG